jgi:FixJ family two-component response regulator
VAKVLIVEDGEAVSESLQVLLEAHGIEGVVAPSPSEALAMIERGEFGVVIHDMRFPPVGAAGGRGGLELFRRLRALDAELPVLVLCAGTSLQAAVQIVKEGANDYLVQPWDDTRLLALTRTLLRLRELQLENDRLKAERTRAREGIADPSGPDAAWPPPQRAWSRPSGTRAASSRGPHRGSASAGRLSTVGWGASASCSNAARRSRPRGAGRARRESGRSATRRW